MKYFSKIILLLFISCNFYSFSQTKKVTGIVLDAKTKKPISKAIINEKNSSKGVFSDNEGKFSVTVSSNTENISVSAFNYATKTVAISDTFLTILLQETENKIEEIVITSSYGTKKRKEELVGSVTTIKAADLQVQQAVESLDKMLDGVAAGVLVDSGSTPGDPVSVNIRGQGTLTPINGNIIGTSTQPLYVIDGVIMSEERGFNDQLFDGGATSEQFKNPLAKIAPEDIESLTILKDAAAVGLYGSDAANGVIIITTKKHKSKNIDINFSTQFGVSNPINQIKYLTGPQYFQIAKDYYLNEGQTDVLATANAGSSTINTNWFNLLNQSGFFERQNLSVGYGFKKFNFRASINRFGNKEPQKNNNYNRIGGNINFGYTSDKFTAQLSVTPAIIKQNEPNVLASFPLPPNISPYDANGNFAFLNIRGQGNPLAVAEQNLYETVTKNVLSSLNLSYKISKNFKINSLFGFDLSNKDQNRYFSAANESGIFNGTHQYTNAQGLVITLPNNGRRRDFESQSFRWNQSSQLLYENSFGKHGVDGIVGYELQKEIIDKLRASATGFLEPNRINEVYETTNVLGFNTNFSDQRRRSVFTQLNYNFDKRFFVLANLRRDESSVFGDNVNAAINGGAGVSWNISNEKFLQNTKWINFLRIRTSYGITGNSRIGSYDTKGLYDLDNQGFDGYNGNPYATPSTAPNNNLSWEKNYKYNIGIDFNIFSRFKMVFEYFNDSRKDMIVSRDIPLETGFSSVEINGSDMVNSGLEFSISSEIIETKNFKWFSNFNIATLKNKVTRLSGFGDDFSTASLARAQRVGISTTAIWGVQFAGIDPATGRELYKKNGQLYDATTYRNLFDASDWEIIGNSQPDFYGGWQNNFTIFKVFTVAIRSAFRYGEDMLINQDLEELNAGSINVRNLSVNVLDYWQQQGDIVTNPIVSSGSTTIANSTKYLYDTSHFKIQNINIGYAIPVKKMRIKGIDTMGVSLDVSNVAYFYKEKALRGKNGIAEYRYLYPEARTITFGFQANF